MAIAGIDGKHTKTSTVTLTDMVLALGYNLPVYLTHCVLRLTEWCLPCGYGKGHTHWHCDRRRLFNIQKPAPACVPVPTVFLRLTEWCLPCGYGKGHMHWRFDRRRLCNIQKPAPARVPVPLCSETYGVVFTLRLWERAYALALRSA